MARHHFTAAEALESREAIKLAVANATKDRNGHPIIYTSLRSVSSSGMMRRITPLVIDATTGKPVNLAWHLERTQRRMADDSTGRWAVKVSGCGMDMGFHLAEGIASFAGLGLAEFTHECL